MGSIAAGRRLTASVVLAVLVTGACSGNDEAAPTTTVPVTAAPTAPQTTTPSTTAPPTTAPPTTAPPTTTPLTTAPPTTIPAATAPLDPATAEPAVTQLMIDYIAAVNELGRDPGNEQLRAALSALAADYALDLFIENADQAVLDNERNRVDPTNPSRVEPLVGTYSFVDATSPVGMDGCVIDTDAQVTTGSDGSEIVGDTTPDSFLMGFTFTPMNGRWMVTDLFVNEQFEDQVGCG